VQRLVGFVRLDISPGESMDVAAHVPADLASFTGRSGDRIVEPGVIELRLGASSSDIRVTHAVTLTGATREVGFDREHHARFTSSKTAL